MSWWTPENQAYAFNYLVNAGLSPYGAAALVSRWVNVESGGQGPFSVNRGSGAFGIAQWLGARLPAIRGVTDFNAQLDYVVSELNSSESRAGTVLRSANDAYTAAVGASMYERAEGYDANTGADHYTSRTANGVNAVLSIAGSAGYGQDSLPAYAGGTDNAGAVGVDFFPAAGMGGVIAAGIGALLLWWLLEG